MTMYMHDIVEDSMVTEDNKAHTFREGIVYNDF